MEQLCYETLEKAGYTGYLLKNAPERVLQFGEGNFLRAFTDYWFDMANEKAGWNGKCVLVQPIAQGLTQLINRQEGLYTLYLRGRQNGEKVDAKRVISCVHDCVCPYSEGKWDEVLALARSEELETVVSNTTEAGIAYTQGDSAFDQVPPNSFPAKLTRVLYERYKAFNGAADKGLVILSCELIDNNGKELQKCCNNYAKDWDLEPAFIDWMNTANTFCSTLVDRIVPGRIRDPQELAALSEAHYHDQIESIADEVLAAGQRIVMLTGPSAAGKTTSAHKIADAIAARGHRSRVISLDDFYIGEGKYPKNPDGSDDYESLEALDLERLHACLKALYKTGVCDAPVFDFTIQRPSGIQCIDARDGVVIIEGLHALNPALTEELPEDAALCLYAGLREEYADSRDARCLATRDIRLARRLVRDCLFRGHGAAFTLGLWGHVCAGEDRYIKPYKPRANLLLDTTHTYEVCLWRTVLDTMPADPALTATQARQLAALREKFAAFPALGTELVPQNSMLREFIGK